MACPKMSSWYMVDPGFIPTTERAHSPAGLQKFEERNNFVSPQTGGRPRELSVAPRLFFQRSILIITARQHMGSEGLRGAGFVSYGALPDVRCCCDFYRRACSGFQARMSE